MLQIISDTVYTSASYCIFTFDTVYTSLLYCKLPLTQCTPECCTTNCLWQINTLYTYCKLPLTHYTPECSILNHFLTRRTIKQHISTSCHRTLEQCDYGVNCDRHQSSQIVATNEVPNAFPCALHRLVFLSLRVVPSLRPVGLRSPKNHHSITTPLYAVIQFLPQQSRNLPGKQVKTNHFNSLKPLARTCTQHGHKMTNFSPPSVC